MEISWVWRMRQRIPGDDVIADVETIPVALSYRQHNAHGDGHILDIGTEEYPVHARPGEIGEESVQPRFHPAQVQIVAETRFQ